MYETGRKRGTVRFAFRPDAEAKSVFLAGDFDSWTPIRMRKQKGGQYVVIVPLSPGAYEYKFIVDDEWVVDPDHGDYAANPYGGMNSVAQVG